MGTTESKQNVGEKRPDAGITFVYENGEKKLAKSLARARQKRNELPDEKEARAAYAAYEKKQKHGHRFARKRSRKPSRRVSRKSNRKVSRKHSRKASRKRRVSRKVSRKRK